MAEKHHVVVDGSNLATEGRTSPSLRQLDEAVQAYALEDPTAEIVVVVDATFGHRIDRAERAQFEQAELHGELVSPPAGAIGRGDAFVLRIAERTGATVLSNDSFQEFHAEHPWLFDTGRLVGGKPVPGVGWIFTPRSPVRGPRSRQVTGKAKKSDRSAELPAPVKAAELAKAARKAARRVAPAADGSAPKIGDVRDTPRTAAAKAAAPKMAEPRPVGAPKAAKRSKAGNVEPDSATPAGKQKVAMAEKPTKKAAAKKTTGKKTVAKETTAKQAATKKAAAKKAAAKKAVTTKAATKKAAPEKATTTKKAAEKKAATKQAAAKKAAPQKTSAKKAAAKKAATTKAVAKKAATQKAPAKKAAATAAKDGPKSKRTAVVKIAEAPAAEATAKRRTAKALATAPAAEATPAPDASTAPLGAVDPEVLHAINDATAEALAPPVRKAKNAGKAKADGKAGGGKRRRTVPPLPAVNEPLPFITFVAAFPLGSEVEGEVASFTSHGAMIEVEVPGGDNVHCYVPLAGLGSPPPRKAREVLSRGERRPFVLVGLDPPRRVAELALPESASILAQAADG
jgi:hypothetical protein